MDLESLLVGTVVLVYPTIEGLVLVYADKRRVLIAVDDEGDFVFREQGEIAEC